MRTNALTRDLSFEESTYLLPGRNFFLNHEFSAYMGELTKVFSPFHKPPLASLLPGLFSFLSFDWIHAGRLVPLLVSLWVCFLPFVFFNSTHATLAAIASPFLLSAASHIQTDTTVGLLGVSLICLSLVKIFSKKERYLFLGVGQIVLWCGKIEIVMFCNFSLFVGYCLLKTYRTKINFLVLYAANLLGIIALFIVSGCLRVHSSAHFYSPFLDIFSQIFGRTSGGSVFLTTLRSMIDRGMIKTLLHYGIYDDLRHHRFFHLIWICFTPPLCLSLMKKLDQEKKETLIFLFLISFTFYSILTFMTGNSRGDMYPRYHLNCIPPALIMLALVSEELRQFKIKFHVAFEILIVALLIPQSIQFLKNQKGITAKPNLTGFREAAEIVRAFTQKNDLILAPEQSVAYLENRKLLVDFTYEPYPENYPAALTFAEEIKAAIVQPRPDPPLISDYDKMMDKLLKPLIKKGAIKINIESFAVYIVPPKSNSKVKP